MYVWNGIKSVLPAKLDLIKVLVFSVFTIYFIIYASVNTKTIFIVRLMGPYEPIARCNVLGKGGMV